MMAKQAVTVVATTTFTARGGSTATAIAAAIAAAAAMTTMASHYRVALTAHKSDPDHREKDRDSKNQCTIHPNFLH